MIDYHQFKSLISKRLAELNVRMHDIDAELETSCSDGQRDNLPASAEGLQFALGVTTISCSFSDDDGNTASASFSVEVVDTTPPNFTEWPGDIAASPLDNSGTNVAFEVSAEDAGGVSELFA